MSTTHRVDKKIKTIFVIAEGSIGLEELLDNEKKILQDPEFEKGYNKYIDFSGAKPAPNADFDQIVVAAEFIAATRNLRGKCKWSIYAPGEDAYNYSLLFARLTKELELDTKIFKNEQEAKEWLGI